MSATPAGGQTAESELGHSRLAERLIKRVEDHFADRTDRTAPHRAVEQSLVIGVFGEWGAGKSTLLKHIGGHFRTVAFPADKSALPKDAITLPIEFNPWRYERESELIVPLLHTTEQVVSEALAQYEGKSTDEVIAEAPGPRTIWSKLFARANPARLAASPKIVDALKGASRFCVVAGIALASGVKFKLSVPMLGEMDVSPKDAIAEAKSLLAAPDVAATPPAERKKLLAEMSSLYYDFQRRLSQITGRGDDGSSGESKARVNLLFLVDDLDRCLPEKAVEMLETIKLFLDVPGCAFVLAIDDEVVERGILHRYRDYLFAHGTERQRASGGDFDVTRPPLTGTEYLEKIIHLPLRLPLPTEKELRSLLLDRYRELFGPALEKDKEPDPAGLEAAKLQPGAAPSATTLRTQEAQQLLDLFVTSVPPVPRKLIRAVDLFLLCGDVARARGWTGFSSLIMARVVLLQLFAPETYRYGRRQPGFLSVLDAYSRDHADEWDLASFDKAKDYKEREKRVYELTDVPLIHLLKMQTGNRNGFRTQRLFNLRWPIASSDLLGIGRYFSLMEEAAPAAAVESSSEELRPLARIDAPADFVALLMSERADAWRSALEPIADQRISDDVLSLVISRVNVLETERAAGTPGWSPLMSMTWLEQLVGHLTASQLQRFYRETRLIERVGKEASRVRHALELLSVSTNPPHQPATRRIALADVSVSALDLSQASLAGRYLRGLDFTGVKTPNDLRFADLRGAHGLDKASRLRGALLSEPRPTPVMPIDGARGDAFPFACLTELSDGRLVSGAGDNTLRLWHEESPGRFAEFAVIHGHSSWVTCVAELPDGRIVSGSNDTTMRIWREERPGRFVEDAVLQGQAPVTSVMALPDGRIVSGAYEGTLRVWRRGGSGAFVEAAVMKGHAASVTSLALLSGGRIVSGGWDNLVRVWREQSASQLAEAAVLRGHTNWVTGVAALPDGRIVSASYDDTLRVWREESTDLFGEPVVLQGHTGGVMSVAVMRDGRFVSSGVDSTVRVWRDENQQRFAEAAALQRHSGTVGSVAVLRDGRLMSLGYDNTVRVWREESPDRFAETSVLQSHPGGVVSVAVLGEQRIVIGGWDNHVRVWTDSGGRFVESALLQAHTEGVSGLAILSDGRIVSGGHDNTVRVWGEESRGRLVEIAVLQGHTAWVGCLLGLGDGRIVSGSGDKTLRVWREESPGRFDSMVVQGHTSAVASVALMRDGRLVSGSQDTTLRVWTGEADGRFVESAVLQGHTSSVTCLTVLQNGRIVSAAFDNTLRMWREESPGRFVEAAMTPTQGSSVTSMVALPDGRIATTSNDNTLHVWRQQDSGELVVEKTATSIFGSIFSMARRTDGQLIVGTSAGLAVLSPELVPETTIAWDEASYVLGSPKRSIRVVPRDPLVVWRTAKMLGRPVPADPRFDRYARYVTSEGTVAPAYEFPDLVEWDDPAKPHELILKWPAS